MQQLSWMATLTIVLLHTVGYAIFRGANRQKDIFRADPSDPRVAHVKTLRTQRGRMLMVSSWWGLSRHINYFGDWLMGCGFSVYPALLLMIWMEYGYVAHCCKRLHSLPPDCAGACRAGWTAPCHTFTPCILLSCCVRGMLARTQLPPQNKILPPSAPGSAR